jgi:hypothetical protein
MTTSELRIDSGILQYVPKGAYYEGKDEQFKEVTNQWMDLLNYDRTLFSLVSLLNGTGFSKGAMMHLLLSYPQSLSNLPVPSGLAFDYETKVIMYNLYKERTPRALKNLLMLTGAEGFPRVNNARTRKIILEFIFNRDNRNLDSLAINYKGKLKTLIRHALGKQDLYKILEGNHRVFDKWIGKHNKHSDSVFLHIFDKEPSFVNNGLSAYFPKIEQYWNLKTAAQSGNVNEFRKYMKGMPQRTVMGFRNTYKIAIDQSEIYEKAHMSDREKLQSESAAKRSGSKEFKVDYTKQDLYDLWKAFYHKLMNNNSDNIDEIEAAIMEKSEKQKKFDVGECVVVIDASKSMVGSDQRPLHPFLTSLCLVSKLDNVKDVFHVGGKIVKTPCKSGTNALIPHNATSLWKGFVDAVGTGIKNIVIISDGYENEVKGMFEHAYNYFQSNEMGLNVLHLNPVFAADSKSGSARKLAKDIEPLPLTDYKFFETEMIFKQMISNRDMVKKILVQKYQQLIK